MKNGDRVLRMILVLFICYSSTYLLGYRIQQEIAEERYRLNEVEREINKYRDLAEQRSQITSYYQARNDTIIRSGFQELADELERAYVDGNILDIEETHLRMRYLYRGVSFVEDLYYFYDALFDYLNNDVNQTLRKMNYVIDNHPNSEKIRQAVNFAQTIYLVRNMNQEYIDLYSRFPKLSTSRSHYWLGHAHYNLGDYARSAEILEQLNNDPDYSFRSYLMLGMIAFANFDVEPAIRTFARTVENYEKDEPYYDFALLSLARIYAHFGFFENSFIAYDDYWQLMGASIEAAVVYEMALVAEESGRDEVAIELLRRIINLPYMSQVFDKALSRLAVISAKEDIANARQMVEDVVVNNNAFISLLSLRKERLQSARDHVDNMLDESVSSREAKLNELDSLFDQVSSIQERQRAIGDFGVDKQEVEVIDFITEEYSALIEIVAEMSTLIEQIAEQPNDKRVEIVDNYVSDIDSLRVDLLSLLFFSNEDIEEVSVWDDVLPPSGFQRRMIIMTEIKEHLMSKYNMARSLARDIVSYMILLDNQENRNEINRNDSSIRGIIELTYQEAETHFGVINYEDDYVALLIEEFEELNSLRQQLLEIRELVDENYHRRLAERLVQVNRSIFENSDDILTFGVSRINNFIYDLENMNLEYNYAMLEVQFRRALNMERDYRKLQQDTMDQTTVDNNEVVYDED